MNDAKTVSSKIETLRKREAALKAAIAAEQVKQQKLKTKKQQRLEALIGNALVTKAEASPEFHLMVNDLLDEAIADTKLRILLAELGWL